jgi:hypothetical protein
MEGVRERFFDKIRTRKDDMERAGPTLTFFARRTHITIIVMVKRAIEFTLVER